MLATFVRKLLQNCEMDFHPALMVLYAFFAAFLLLFDVDFWFWKL
jgi:hypothetical protein